MEPPATLIFNLTRGNVICEQTAIATRPGQRMRGLLGRRSLPSGEGMLLQPAPSIHTAFMRFPIDVVFLDGTLRVLKVIERLTPWRLASARHAWAVLELAVGEVKARAIEVGDYVGVIEVDDHSPGISHQFGANGSNWSSDASSIVTSRYTRAVDEPSPPELQPDVAAPGGEMTRVLVVGKDRRFRSVAAALLTQRGCAVMLGDRPTDAADLATREGADVVVLDAGTSATRTNEEAARIESLDPPVGVVVVGDEAIARAGSPVLAKWGSFERLYAAIEAVRPRRVESTAHGKSLGPL